MVGEKRRGIRQAWGVALIVGLGLGGGGNAWGYFYNGADLLDFQQHYQQFRDGKTYDTSKFFTYTGYVLGIFDRLEAEESICAPGDIKGRDVLNDVAHYLDNTPGSWNDAASDVVTDALQDAYPCQ